MKKLSMMLLVGVFAAIGFAVRGTAAQQEKKEKMASAKELRWHGTVVRSDKDNSTLTVRRRGQSVERIIHYDSSTKWTKQEGKKVTDIDPSEVKDGADVIVLGTADEKGEFHATRIDLRAQ